MILEAPAQQVGFVQHIVPAGNPREGHLPPAEGPVSFGGQVGRVGLKSLFLANGPMAERMPKAVVEARRIYADCDDCPRAGRRGGFPREATLKMYGEQTGTR